MLAIYTQSATVVPFTAAVTYEPPGMTGLQELQWLDNISKPRVRHYWCDAALLIQQQYMRRPILHGMHMLLQWHALVHVWFSF